METKQDELQRLQISYEIAMAIGASLDLTQMLRESVRAFLKKLNCVSGSVLQLVEDGDGRYQFQQSYAIPRQPERNETYRAALAAIPTSLDAGQLAQFRAQLPIVAQAENGNYYHIFDLPEFGLLLLVKNKRPLDPELIPSLKPLGRKLATAGNACLAEQARRVEAQYHEIFDTLEDGYYETDLAGNVTFFNKGLAQVLGYPAEDLPGINYKSYTDPETRQQIFDAYSQVYQTGQSQSAFLWKHTRKDGSSSFIEASISLKRDSNGRPVGFRGIMRDVTSMIEKQRQAEQRMRLQHTALNSAANGVAITDREGTILWVNKAFTQTTQYSAEEVIGQNTRILSSGLQPPEFYEDMWQTILAGRPWRGELVNKRKDGSLYTEEMTITPVRATGDAITHFVAIWQDITDRKKAEDALAKRADELETVAQVSAAVATLMEPAALLQEVVDLVKKRFNLYHAHIFLLDDTGKNLILKAGTGKAGQQMVAEKLSIAITQKQSLVAQAARTRQTVIVNDVLNEPGFLPNPLLPDTRAEMAVPLIVGKALLGVLDVQATSLDYFSAEDAEIQAILATQVAVALENARKYEQMQRQAVEMQVQSTALNAAAAGILITNREGIIQWVNAGFTKLTQYTSEEVVGQTPNVLNSGKQDKAFFAKMWQTILRGDVWQGELINRRKDGSLYSEEMTITPVRAQGEEISHFIAIKQDITRRKETERALAASLEEIETVQDVSLALTAAGDLPEFLHNLATTLQKHGLAQNITRITYTEYELNAEGEPETGVNKAVWQPDGEKSPTLGLRYPVRESPVSHLFLADPSRPFIVEDVLNDERLDNAAKEMFAAGAARAVVSLPLQAAGRWLGLLTLVWADPQSFDEKEKRVYQSLLGPAAGTINSQRLLARSRESLAELDALTRRLTREGWQEYLASRAAELKFVYDLNEVQPAAPDMEIVDQADLAQSIVVQGEPVGKLALADVQADPQEVEEILTAVAASLSAHLENLRLTEQTQAALSQTELLYQYSARLSAAASFHEILEAVAQPAMEQGAFCATLFTYEQGEAQRPSYATVAATLDQEGLRPGERIYLPDFPPSQLWFGQGAAPLLINNVQQSAYVDQETMAFLQQMKTGAMISMPVTIGGLRVGHFVIRWREPRAFTEADQRLFDSIAGQAASVVYNRMLFKQTDEALSETAALYQASADINAATTFDDIVRALRHHTILGQNINNISLNYFDRPWEEQQPPEWIEVLTRWSQLPPDAVSSRYPLSVFPSASTLLRRDAPTIIEDVLNDPRLDENVRALYAERFQAQSTIFVPLVLGNQWVGYVNAIYPQKTAFPDKEVRRVVALSRQAAVAIQGIRLLEATEARARREQALREIAAKVRSSADVDVVMRTAVQEIGKALGRQAWLYLQPGNGEN